MLKSREEHLQNLFTSAQDQLTKLSSNEKAYKKLLCKLLVEGLLILHENAVEVEARSGDVQTIQGLLDDAIKQYKDTTGRDTRVHVSDGLSKDCAGGFVMTAKNGKIRLDNTLEQRLKLLEEQVRIEIHTIFFFLVCVFVRTANLADVTGNPICLVWSKQASQVRVRCHFLCLCTYSCLRFFT